MNIARILKRNRPSVKTQIERQIKHASKDNPTNVFFKEPRRRMEKPISGTALRKSENIITVHTAKSSGTIGSALPAKEEIASLLWVLKQKLSKRSAADHAFENFFRYSPHSRIGKTTVFASVSEKGKVLGYTFIQPKKEIIKPAAGESNSEIRINNTIDKLMNKREILDHCFREQPDFIGVGHKTLRDNQNNLSLQYLWKKYLEDAGFRLKFIPMKGCKFDDSRYCFVEKK